MSRTIIATTAILLVLASLIYKFVPVPDASAGSGGGSTNYSLTLQFQGTGSVHLNPPNVTRTSGVTYSFAQGTVVNLSASAPTGWRFLRWENALTGSSSTGSVTMTSNKTVKAVFVQCKLTVHKQGNGQVNVDPPDETLTPTFTKTYSGITNVELTAIPDAGWAFKEWTGDHTGTSNPATFQVDREETVTAVFEQIKLTVNKSGEGKVSATPPGGAAQTPSFTKYYGTNTTVSLTAIPEPGWAFKEWTGAISSTDNPASVLVNGDKTVRAVFEEIKLTVNKEGNGQVSASPPGLTQSPPFTIEYGTITTVTLTAIPEPGWAFVEWTGDLSGTDNPAEILVDEVKSVTAVFEERKLTISKEGEGQVSAAPPGGAQTPTFTVNYSSDTEVTLTALPAVGWIFKEWTGDVSGTDNPAEITVDREKAVTAVFEQIELTVERNGLGNVTLSPPNVTQTPTFTQTYSSATSVTLTAVPDTNWVFKEWTGDITSTSNPATITVDRAKKVKAIFGLRHLAVDKVGFGSVNVDPPNETLQPYFIKTYATDTNVTLTAVSNVSEWGFKEWTGDVTGTSPTVTLLVDDAKSVTAVFEKIRLTVNGEGEGTVTVDPPNQTLLLPSYKDYQAGQLVTLVANPASGWGFKEWTGAASGTSATTTVTMDKAKSVTAVFGRIALTVNKEGEGQVTVDPPNTTQTPSFTRYYPLTTPATVVSLTPVPASGWGFKEWRGVKRGKEENNPLSLTMSSDDSVTAVFAQVELNVDKEGEGQVAISPPGGVQTLPYSQTLGYGTEAMLNATPATGWNFVRWEGDVPAVWAEDNPLEMRLSGDTDLTAIFEGNVVLEFGLSVSGVFKSIDPVDLSPVAEIALDNDARIGCVTGDTIIFRSLPDDGNIWGGKANGATGPRAAVTFDSVGESTVTVSARGVQRTATIVTVDVPPPGQYEWILSQDPDTIYWIDVTRQEAQAWGQEVQMGGGWLNGRTNACVHAYWSALLTLRIGATLAMEATTSHEYSGLDEQPNNAPAMDMLNNAVGIAIGENLSSQPLVFGYEVRNAVINAVNSGELVMLTCQESNDDLGLLILTNQLALPNIPTALEPAYWRDPSLQSEQIVPHQ
jgi:hypothetical protein